MVNQVYLCVFRVDFNSLDYWGDDVWRWGLMAKIAEIDQEGFSEWLSDRPPIIQDLATRFPPDRLYSLSPNGQKVTIHSYSEDGTVTVDVSGQYNFVMFDRQVFGINPDDLSECDLPSENDATGTILTESEDVEGFIDEVRPHILSAREAEEK